MRQPTSAAQADFDEITAACLDLAQMRLDSGGSTSTYAVMKPIQGELLAHDVSEDDLSAQDAEVSVLDAITKSAHLYRAVGLTCTIEAMGSELVRVDLEHRDGVWQTILLPFSRDNGVVEFGELQNTPGLPRIWSL